MSYKINDRNTILNSGRQYKITRVKDMPDEEKPREKMLENGPGA
jgi:hypothetical protein